MCFKVYVFVCFESMCCEYIFFVTYWTDSFFVCFFSWWNNITNRAGVFLLMLMMTMREYVLVKYVCVCMSFFFPFFSIYFLRLQRLRRYEMSMSMLTTGCGILCAVSFCLNLVLRAGVQWIAAKILFVSRVINFYAILLM